MRKMVKAKQMASVTEQERNELVFLNESTTHLYNWFTNKWYPQCMCGSDTQAKDYCNLDFNSLLDTLPFW